MSRALAVHLTENFSRGNDAEQLMIDTVATVGIEKPVTVFVGLEIEKQRPSAPKKIHVTVTDTAVSEIYEFCKFPILQHYIRQAVIAVNERVRAQKVRALGEHRPCLVS